MQQIITHLHLNNIFLLSSKRCIFWEQEKTLILSDLHFGKTGHFRKEGIAVPQAVYKEDLQCLVAQIQFFKPSKLIIIGDMFHSHANKELDFFLKWRNDFAQLSIKLIRGNHDILKDNWYKEASIEVVEKLLTINQFSFTHDMSDITISEAKDQYFFSGHIHPAIAISGIAKQSLRMPCFYFAKGYAVLPAFSRFTGNHTIKPKRGETVFAILPSNASTNETGSIIKL
jgi:DNA ligase-associated metallophosphoesterase